MAQISVEIIRLSGSLLRGNLQLSVMASFKSTTEREHKEKLLEDRNEQQEQLQSVVDDLDASVFGLIRGIRGVTDAVGLSDTQKIAAIQTLPDRVQSGTFDRLKADLCDTTQDRSWHDVLEARSLWLQNRLIPSGAKADSRGIPKAPKV